MKRAFQYVTHYGSANQEFADASVRRYEQKGVLRAGVPSRSPQSPPLFPFLPIPYPLPLSTPATQAIFPPMRSLVPGYCYAHVIGLPHSLLSLLTSRRWERLAEIKDYRVRRLFVPGPLN